MTLMRPDPTFYLHRAWRCKLRQNDSHMSLCSTPARMGSAMPWESLTSTRVPPGMGGSSGKQIFPRGQ